ncbi:MAG: PorT family protein [Chitinophagaceae bacterium]|nr:PorT family protein [Chitinophagaceae bacterium]MBK8300976.1 PorT family protein [Chitinophagaceae bacterium]MBK9465191.1 PorT family protein [Chitinophagaceae bacterium]MBK9660336.1 PorT family protein [Chitinophagaceae bacterium]MBK9938332.1 PorT family protein [Chitinophagaceae bacterium]
MKKISICALALFTTLAMQAQNKKGNWLLGASLGSTGYSFGKSESGTVGSTNISYSDNNSFNLGIYPTVGYYISDNVILGTYFTVGFSNSKNDNSNNYSSNTSESKSNYGYFGLGPFGRFYFGNNGGKGQPFAEVSTGITFYPGYKGEYIPNTGTGYTYEYEKYHPWNAGVKFGYEHFINETVGIQYYIGYTHSNYQYNTVYKYPSLPDAVYTYESSSNNISFGAGLQIHLNCGKKKKK